MRTIKHETKEEAMATHGRDFATAVNSGKWMAVVWQVKGGENEVVELAGRTTWNFPPEAFESCVEDLRANLAAEGGGQPVKNEPLPFADFLEKQTGKVIAAMEEVKKSDGNLVMGTGDAEPPLGRIIESVKAEDNKMPEVEEELDRARALADARKNKEVPKE